MTNASDVSSRVTTGAELATWSDGLLARTISMEKEREQN